ncbi:GAF domain-containing sensor histidine kinase [Pelagicoccus sp. SDUM812002]|uniref:GAF domain-containing sensor histidine kinase n=1 Tax=Pelagicoccus sp. SDUM812002 TaxID=3041266 RepID=UPI0028104271|nr:GAF domain-containing sensor histidine kinase [Pelagicoccus sp. SDUM812002]MDQ8184918.1 GAF domain-containing sensor histidine kinase [Pelagicoccus sp. SDUM812002]
MTIAPFPEDEPDRLEALKRYGILDTEAEELFDSIAKIAATICDVPIALISLIDEERQWFKSRIGIDAQETPREYAFCSHAILDPESLLVVTDASIDPRFRENPLVTGEPDIRFYAGSPIVTHDRQPLGTLCVIDTKTRELTEQQREALRHLSKQVCANLELRLARKKLEQLNEAKNKFFSVLAHDLRSPIYSILSIAELLVDPDSRLNATQEEEFKKHLLNNARVTSQTAENLLGLIQFEEGRFNFDPQTVVIREILSSSESSLSGACRSKKIDILTICDPSITAWADPRLLQSITQNLLSNAVKFSPLCNKVILTATSDGENVKISVQDFGKGIKANVLENILTSESSYSSSGTAGEHGSGLGLTLCKQFAKRLGGNLVLVSEYGGGTTAVLTIPAREPADG